MNFPIEKYRFIVTDTKVIALTTYAGKTVKGIAKLDPRDKFDEEYGKKLAAARCNAKVAKRRVNRARAKVQQSTDNIKKALLLCKKATKYRSDSLEALRDANEELEELIQFGNLNRVD